MSNSNIVATGGTVKRIGLSSHLTHTFTESGDFVVNRPVIVRYLIVGGRGGGPAPDEKNKVDQEGGIGEIIEGTTTYQLQPGTYKVTVGPRSTKFTEKEIAGTGYTSGGIVGNARVALDNRMQWVTFVTGLNQPVAWSGRHQRVFNQGNTSSIANVAEAKGGAPHPGISNKPVQQQQNGMFLNAASSSRSRNQPGGMGSKCIQTGGPYWSDGCTNQCTHFGGGGAWCSQYQCIKSYTLDWKCAAASDRPAARFVMDLNDRTWRPVGTPNTSNQKDSDIAGTAQKYGLKPMVIIRYDESTAGAAPPATPSPDAIAEIEKAYAVKMQALKDAAEAEKKALQAQNATAAAEAQKIQSQLIAELNGLKTQYDQLKTTVSDATGQLETAKTELSQIKTEYASKMAELKAAQKAEIDALNSKNATALEAARLAQQQIVSELTTLKTQYDSLLASSSTCPTIPDGTIVIDAKDGQLYKYDMAQLRPMSNDTYRTLGSPAYTTYPAGSLDKCPRGPVYTVQTLTEPPVTTPPSGPPVFDGTLYILVHGKSWTEHGELKVVATRFGGATIESFKFKDLAQVFVINNDGFIRNLADRGLYLTSKTGCLATGATVDVPDAGWTFKKSAGSKYAYGLVSKCGSALSATAGAREPVLEKTNDDWFVVPVGKATIA